MTLCVYTDHEFARCMCRKCARKGDIPIDVDEPGEYPFVCDVCSKPIGNPLSQEALSHLAWEIYHATRNGIKDKTLTELGKVYHITNNNCAQLAYP